MKLVSLSDQVDIRFINLLLSNLIGPNSQSWCKVVINSSPCRPCSVAVQLR